MIKRPLLAPQKDPSSYPDFFKELQYPLLVSPKFDGIRGIVQNGRVLSRSMKPLRSYQAQDRYADMQYCDGELIIGDPTNPDCYNLCQSHIMSFDKPHEDLRYYVFDFIRHTHLPFYRRLEEAECFVNSLKEITSAFFVPHSVVETEEALLKYEEACLSEGYEGIMMRDPLSHYKEGRATWKEGIIYKLKRFTDTEARIVGFEERLINTNEQEKDERGYAKRSKAANGLVASGLLGKFLVEYDGEILPIAPGNFKHEQLEHIWLNQGKYLGKWLKFRYFSYGIKDLPRFPRAIGFRDEEDM